MTESDTSADYRVFRVLLHGDVGWFEQGIVTLAPGESVKTERGIIAKDENLPCRLIGRHL